MKAVIYYSENCGFTITSMDGENIHPIASDGNLAKAKEKFEDTTKLAMAVINVTYFKDHGNFKYREKDIFPIEYNFKTIDNVCI